MSKSNRRVTRRGTIVRLADVLRGAASEWVHPIEVSDFMEYDESIVQAAERLGPASAAPLLVAANCKFLRRWNQGRRWEMDYKAMTVAMYVDEPSESEPNEPEFDEYEPDEIATESESESWGLELA